ncbi:MAG: CHAT domain-containing tetratricopeptide repeat protein [Desulfovibrio sp.]|uniref:CHAT domain-containing tetratricopeptide repeat protein n=1 Tax=Desulfovibrio sp. TaxID=885 RepID=UPI002A36886A|nr:CHAT domain-containing tetratricopeptide repeat protein [Desulfovibrio sp.]MDY0260058.1 CHAT domain-containing tetratricopeptide repeat protein [Desulfovibrio sp.]
MRRILLIIAIVIVSYFSYFVVITARNDFEVMELRAKKLYDAGRHADAIEMIKKNRAKFEKKLGKQHPWVALSSDVLARLYIAAGDYKQAVECCEQALALQEMNDQSKPKEVVSTLILLSEAYLAEGEFFKAEPLMQRALEINEKNFGPDNMIAATILNNLGLLYTGIARYDKAEIFLQHSLSITEKLNPEDPEIATTLGNLGNVYCKVSAYEKAEAIVKRAILIREKKLGPDHLTLAPSLSALAVIYVRKYAYSDALQLMERALAIAESKLDPWHPELANYLGLLGVLHCDLGEYAEAEVFYLRALEIQKKALGPNHPDFAMIQGNLGVLYRRMGEASKAEYFYRTALEISEKKLGSEHPQVASNLLNLATALVAQDKQDQALPLMQRGLDIEKELIDQVMGMISEAQKIAFLSNMRVWFDVYMTVVATQVPTNRAARDHAFAVWLKRKGAALEAQRQFREALIQAGDPQGKILFERLAQLCTEVTELTFMGPREGSAEAHQARLAELKKEQADIEAELAKCSQNYARDRKRRQVDAATVAKALPAGSTLVDFAKIDIYDFKAADICESWKPSHYIAFVLPAGNPDSLTLIDLGEATPIEQAVAALRLALQDGQNPEAIALFGHRLNRLVFAPLATGIGNAKNIFISPDGVLNLIPFEILRDSNNRLLIEKYTFNYVCSGRDLVAMDDVPAAKGRSLVLGDPDFDMDAHATSASNAASGHMAEATQPGRTFQRSADLRALTLNPLPATRVEAEAVAKMIGENARLRVGADAVESELQKGPAPRYLHLATHGFFLSDQEMQDTLNSRGPEVLSQFSSFSGLTSDPARHYENPLARSGIALAGANTALKGMGIDGIVTAEKFLTMPINGTEIVVLSACQTGLGDVKTGEGVFGLRRAITQAGAKGMVMSMWSVPDKETQELMEFFYDNLAKGMPKAQALRHAALKERDITRKRFNSDNPLYWGAFIYIGDK